MRAKKQVGVIGVDAGICWIGDPSYIIHPPKLPLAVGRDWLDFCDKLESDVTQFEYDLGHDGLGVCVATGYGDGEYPVYVERDESGRIARVIVDFMLEDESQDGGR
ncbi:MAG TPA: hypothetical protein DDZ88_12130 [Verrucomicrobiales bacterium]|nr:hypothetical protein [Verrucomicrobiales bacterium]